MLPNRYYFLALFSGIFLFCSPDSEAQLMAYGGKKTDNNCKIIYLVNPSIDSIFYIGGLEQKELSECQTFYGNKNNREARYSINVSGNEEAFLLLLPKDTLAYNIIIPAGEIDREKELYLLSKYSMTVIGTNQDKKRYRQIKRLNGSWMCVPVKE